MAPSATAPKSGILFKACFATFLVPCATLPAVVVGFTGGFCGFSLKNLPIPGIFARPALRLLNIEVTFLTIISPALAIPANGASANSSI